MPFISMLGNGGILWIIIGLVLAIDPKHRKMAWVLFLALGIEFLLCNVLLKNLFAMPRPCDLNPSVALLIPKPQDYSFPSGHTASSFAAVTVLYLMGVKRWYWALVPAGLIAFSRMYLDVHFPIDILGGIFVGILCGFLVCKINWFQTAT